MKYSSFLQTSDILLKVKPFDSFVEQRKYTCSRHVTQYNTHFKYLRFYFTDTFKTYFEGHNYSKFVHIFSQSLPISTPFHTRK
jgi:hypothetical protein